jgi:hypothetical protein
MTPARRFALLLCCALPIASFATEPEISRPVGKPQAVGVLHGLRTIPEACARLEGRFDANAAAPYALSARAKSPCQPRAMFDTAMTPPAAGAGWILNDVIRVPRADRADCIATISVWRHPGTMAPIEHDGQQRVRLYLDQPVAKTGEKPRFAASVETSAACAP